LAGKIAGEGLGLSVHYQVTYTNGTVSDLTDVPATNEGILRVVRIARLDGGGGAYEVLSTGRGVMSQVGQSRTFSRDMEWDGRAWVVRPLPQDILPPPVREPSGPPPAMLEAAARIEGILEAKRLRMAELGQAFAEAELTMIKAKGSTEEPAARKMLEVLRAAREDCRDSVAQLQAVLALLRGEGPSSMPAEQDDPGMGGFDRPKGHLIHPPAGVAPQADMGVVHPIDGRIVPPHRLQVWPLPPRQGPRTYEVMMAHGEAGPLGAFRYVACADTDGDAAPDQVIAYSPLAVADAPGGWSAWTFQTDQERVFVGNTWPNRDTVIFATSQDMDDNWRGLGTEVYVSGDLEGLRCHKHRQPFMTNLRVRQVDQNPD
jgi:hypothetical protein